MARFRVLEKLLFDKLENVGTLRRLIPSPRLSDRMYWFGLVMVLTTIPLAVLPSVAGPFDGLNKHQPLPGAAQIRGKAGPTDIVITTTPRLAGAIDSLTWGGKQFIDSTDHGRQLQSAATFGSSWKTFHPETFNPTEAGSSSDGMGPRSTSQLVGLQTRNKNELFTVVRPAFWLAPGQRDADGFAARNTTRLSNHLISKHVTIGAKGLEHVIEYKVTFTIPPGERHEIAQFEAITGYMPDDFSKFWTLDMKTGKLAPLTDGPGEQDKPVVFSTPDGKYAMGVWSPQQPSKNFADHGYGRFRFPTVKVVKWNCVFRREDRNGILPGNYTFQCYVAVGTLQNVRDSLLQVSRKK